MVKPDFHKGFIVVGALIIFGMAGCASIMKGTQHELSIESNPQNAKVSITIMSSGMEITSGTTPFTTSLAKKHEYFVTISLEGYEDKKVAITQVGIQGWFWGNIICGGGLGLIVDYIDGAMYKMGPSEINVSLTMAYVPETGEEELFAVISAYDDYGELRTTWVRLVRSTNVQLELISSF